MKHLMKYTLCAMVGLVGTAHAQTADETEEMGMPPVPRDETQTTWLDNKRYNAKDYLNKAAHHMDKWFGKTDPSDPAHASLRIMTDVHWNEYDGTTIKPRVRGKLKLPTLENRLSVVFGDDDLDSDNAGGIHNDERAVIRTERRFDRRQSRQENSSLGLRWSRFQENKNIETDVDLGVRSDDIYLKMRAGKRWELPKDVNAYVEQMYRYGSKSEHYALTTLEFSQPQSSSRTLINRTHLHYTHKDTEHLNWANSLYQQHYWQAKHGQREFSYGIYAGGDIEDKKANLNIYGPYVSYRQPVWREWLFLQGDVSYYNNKSENKDHHLGVFGRVEMVF
ncbi:MAG: hypothetical protein Q4B81_02005 [Moraxella sp.]|nr:hypothetical protein [Moraxella sp.]